MSMIYFSKFWDTASAAHCQVLYLKNKSGILSSRTKTGIQRNRPHSLLSSSSFNLNTLLRTCLQYSNTQRHLLSAQSRGEHLRTVATVAESSAGAFPQRHRCLSELSLAIAMSTH